MSAEAVRYVLALNIKPAALKFYVERVAYRIDNDKGFAWPTQDLIASEMSVSARTVRKYQEDAVKLGLIRALPQTRRDGTFAQNHYEIPGFIDWLKNSDQSAQAFFDRANADSLTAPSEDGGPTVSHRKTGGLRPEEDGGPTVHRNTGGLLKEKGKDKRKDTPTPCGAGHTDEQGEASQSLSPSQTASEASSCLDLAAAGATSAGAIEASNQKAKGPTFAAFWAAYPKKVGKARAEKKWKRMLPEDRQAAIDAIGPYLKLDKCQNGFVMEGGTFLNQEAWKDFAEAAAEASQQSAETQIKAVALDLANGETPDRIKAYGWNSFEEVRRKAGGIYSAAMDFAKANFEWKPQHAFAAAA